MRKWPSSDRKSSSALLDLGLPSLQTVRKPYRFINHTAYGIFLQKPEHTMTNASERITCEQQGHKKEQDDPNLKTQVSIMKQWTLAQILGQAEKDPLQDAVPEDSPNTDQQEATWSRNCRRRILGGREGGQTDQSI